MLQQSLDCADLSAVLETARDGGTFSDLELCELSTLAQRVSVLEVKMRLVAMVGQLPEEQLQASMAMLKGVGGGESIQSTGEFNTFFSELSVLSA